MQCSSSCTDILLEAKVVIVHVMRALEGKQRGIAPSIKTLATLPQGKTPLCTLSRSMVGPQKQCALEQRNLFFLTGIKPQMTEPITW